VSNSKDRQDELIKLAEAPSAAHIEETSENTEEPELDEGWDPTAVEGAPSNYWLTWLGQSSCTIE
jgi:hypothetical protein